MIQHTPLATRDEWLKARKIGASDVAVLMGETTFGRTEYDLWARIVRGPKEEKKAHFSRGHRFETATLKGYAESRGWLWCDSLAEYAAASGPRIVQPGPYVITSNSDYPWLTVSLDAMSSDGERIQPVDAKTSRGNPRGKWGRSGEVIRSVSDCYECLPLDYYWQMQAQMVATGAQVSAISALIAFMGFDERYFIVHRNEADCKRMIERCSSWWAKHIDGNVAPEIDHSAGATRDLIGRFERNKADKREATPTEAHLVREIHANKELIEHHGSLKRSAEKAHDLAKNQLIAEMGATSRASITEIEVRMVPDKRKGKAGQMREKEHKVTVLSASFVKKGGRDAYVTTHLKE